MKNRMKLLTTVALAVISAPLFGLQLNEIRIDQPEFPDDDGYVEIKGTPGESLDGVWFLFVGDHSPSGSPEATKGSGVVELALNLSAYSIPDDGHFMIFGSNFDLSDQFQLSAEDFDFLYEGIGDDMENSDNVTALLVRDFTGNGGEEIRGQVDQLGTLAVDIDDDDNGVPNEVLPWTEVIDAIGLFEAPSSGEFCYGAALGFENIGPDRFFVPSHVWRGSDSNRWFIGEYNIFEVDQNGTVIGLNPEGFDTPSRPNPIGLPDPVITGLSTIFVEPGDQVTVSGFNLSSATSVLLGETELSFSVSEEDLVINIPEGVVNDNLRINTPDGVAFSENDIVFIDKSTVVDAHDFSDPPESYNIINKASNTNWIPGKIRDANVIEISGFRADTASDDWVITPELDLTNLTNSYIVLGHRRAFSGPPLEVKISTDYSGSGDPGLANWVDLQIVTAPDSASDIIDSGKTDISAYDGSKIHVGIRYTSLGPNSGEGAIDTLHYFIFGGEEIDWMESPNFGLVYPYPGDIYYSIEFGFIDTSDFPYVYQMNSGFFNHFARAEGIGTWVYSYAHGWIFVPVNSFGQIYVWNEAWTLTSWDSLTPQ